MYNLLTKRSSYICMNIYRICSSWHLNTIPIYMMYVYRQCIDVEIHTYIIHAYIRIRHVALAFDILYIHSIQSVKNVDTKSVSLYVYILISCVAFIHCNVECIICQYIHFMLHILYIHGALEIYNWFDGKFCFVDFIECGRFVGIIFVKLWTLSVRRSIDMSVVLSF